MTLNTVLLFLLSKYSSLIAVAMRTRTRRSASEETEHSFLVPTFGEKRSVSHHGISLKVFTENKMYCAEKVSFCSYFCIFSKKSWTGGEFWQLIFLHILIMWVFLLILWIIQIVLWMWKQLFLPEINLTWTSCTIVCMLLGSISNSQ